MLLARPLHVFVRGRAREKNKDITSLSFSTIQAKNSADEKLGVAEAREAGLGTFIHAI